MVLKFVGISHHGDYMNFDDSIAVIFLTLSIAMTTFNKQASGIVTTSLNFKYKGGTYN